MQERGSSMGWSISIGATARADAEAAIDAAQPGGVSDGAAAQVAVAKDLAKAIVRALPDAFVQGNLGGHFPDPGTWPYGSITAAMQGAPTPETAEGAPA